MIIFVVLSGDAAAANPETITTNTKQNIIEPNPLTYLEVIIYTPHSS